MNETNWNFYFQYKYQINLDGTVAAYRFPYLMGGNSVVLKQDSPYYEHFYKSLEPGKHYIPFKRDLSDLREKILWAKNHDEEVIKFIASSWTLKIHKSVHQYSCVTAVLLVQIICYCRAQNDKLIRCRWRRFLEMLKILLGKTYFQRMFTVTMQSYLM